MVNEAKAWRSKAKQLRRLAEAEIDRCWAGSLLYLADEAEKTAVAFEEVNSSGPAE